MNLYFLSRMAGSLARRLAEFRQSPALDRDPIDHPAIAAMSLGELADLPLSPPRPLARAPRASEPAAPRRAA